MPQALHLIGTNFKKTSLERVARVQWPRKDLISTFLTQVRQAFPIEEIFFLQTCNRREFYLYAPDLDIPGQSFLPAFLEAVSGSLGQTLDATQFYHYQDHAAARHLFRVAASLDSMVLGETEIIKQIRDQSDAAFAHGHINRRLKALVEAAIWTSKQVRHQTEITKNVVSLASLAYRRVSDFVAGHNTKRVVFVGAGHFIASILPTFSKDPDFDLIFVNRTLPAHLAEQYGGRAMELAAFLRDPAPFDAMISATAAPGHLFDAAWFAARGGGQLLLDAALPRDIDPQVSHLPDVSYLDLEEMEAILAANRAARQAEIPKTEPIFDQGLGKLESRWLECDLATFHRQISSHFRETGDRALSYLLKQDLPDLSHEETEKLRKWTRTLVGKLTNVPILGLKGVARDIGPVAVEAYTKNVASKSRLCFQRSASVPDTPGSAEHASKKRPRRVSPGSRSE